MQKLTESLHEMREAISKQLNNLYNVVTYRNSNIIVAKRARQMKLEDEAIKAQQSKGLGTDNSAGAGQEKKGDSNTENQVRRLGLVHPILHDYGKIGRDEQMLHSIQEPSWFNMVGVHGQH